MISLYYAPDNASLIVRIVLEETSLPYKAILVDRRANGQRNREFLSLNPNGLIPVCIINKQPVFETAAIVLSIADTHRQLHVPIDNDQRPQFLKWLFFLSNSLHTDLRQWFYPEKYAGHDNNALNSFKHITFKRLLGRLNVLEALYDGIDSNYLFGADPTINDIYLAVCVRWLQLYPSQSSRLINLSDFPSIKSMVCKLERREPIIKACQKEGISGAFFSNPEYANPLEGSAT